MHFLHVIIISLVFLKIPVFDRDKIAICRYVYKRQWMHQSKFYLSCILFEKSCENGIVIVSYIVHHLKFTYDNKYTVYWKIIHIQTVVWYIDRIHKSKEAFSYGDFLRKQIRSCKLIFIYAYKNKKVYINIFLYKLVLQKLRKYKRDLLIKSFYYRKINLWNWCKNPWIKFINIISTQ